MIEASGYRKIEHEALAAAPSKVQRRTQALEIQHQQSDERSGENGGAAAASETSLSIAADLQSQSGHLAPLSPHHDDPNDDSSASSSQRQRQQQQQRQWAVALFSITTILLFADQNLMAPNLTAMARDFGFDDKQRDQKLGGDIALAFFVLGAPASFVVGCLGDTYNRTRLFALTVSIGEGACLATFFAQTYSALYCCRAVTGFALGGALPLIYSILGDLFVAQDRHFVNAIVGIGTGVGISLGQGVAGFLGPTLGWRLPFLVISAPALCCAALVLLTVRDPERGGMEAAILEQHRHHHHESILDRGGGGTALSVEMVPLQQEEPTPTPSRCLDADALTATSNSPKVANERVPGVLVYWRTFEALITTPTVVLTLLQGAPGCVPWGIVNSFLNDFLAENRGMSVEAATMVILIFGMGNFFGLLLGGGFASRLYLVDKRYPALLAGSMAIGGCFPFWILLNWIDRDSNIVFLIVVGVSAGILSGGTGPIVKATLQNVTLPHARGQAFALFNTFDDFGRGLGPAFIARCLIYNFGRTLAFNLGVIGWILCGLMNLAMYFTVVHDEDSVQRRLTASLTYGRR